MLVFPRQTLSARQLASVARAFGPVERHGFLAGLSECPDVLAIHKRPGDVQNFGGAWHSDNSYLAAPPMGALLHAQVVPAVGGDTEWANQYEALSALPEATRRRIDGLRACHASAIAFGGLSTDAAPEGQHVARHPVVRIHPETQRASLFHSGACTVGFEGLGDGEAARLSAALLGVATRPEFTFRHSWSQGDVVFWDNRCTMHRALNDYPGQVRLMHRVTIAGAPPKSSP